MVAAVIFDMDGLMFDTERLARDAWHEVGRRLGCPIGEGVFARILGATPQASAKVFREAFGDGFDYPLARKMCSEWMEERIDRHGVPVKPGLGKLLIDLRDAGIRRAVASSSPRATVEKYLRLTGLAHFFDAVIGAEDVARSKPAPDSFLVAARALETRPERCLVLEDSENGLLAARNAGMKAVCVPDLTLPGEAALSAAAVLPSLEYVFEWLVNADKGP